MGLAIQMEMRENANEARDPIVGGQGIVSIRWVLCEDDHWCWMRPLSWGVPAWDIPVGMYSLRERVDNLKAAGRGLFLTRPGLGALARQENWSLGWSDPLPGVADLWVSSRLGPYSAVLAGLRSAAANGREFVWLAGGRLVAAALSGESTTRLQSAWQSWALAAEEAGKDPARPLEGFAAGTFCESGQEVAAVGDAVLLIPDPDSAGKAADFVRTWTGWQDLPYLVLNAIWEVVPATEAVLAKDVLQGVGQSAARRPYGLTPTGEDPVWAGSAVWTPMTASEATGRWPGVHILGDPSWVVIGGEGVDVEPGVVLDVRHGPVALGRWTRIQSGSRLEGPLALGPGCRVKAGARLYGGTSLGIGCRVAGEIGETVAMHFLNKQHDGFIGHAVLGSWMNLGALTTCSDLKNNYGSIRVDLGFGPVDTGSRFVGLLAADHVKTAIGTLLNTGTCLGFAANIFGTGMPPKSVTGFSWGWDGAVYDTDKAVATAEVVMGRRDCLLTADHKRVFRMVAGD